MNFLLLKQLAAIVVGLLAVGAAYISFIYEQFREMIYLTQGSPMRLNLVGAVICYLALTGVLYVSL